MIESLNSVARKSTRNRKVFPDDQSVVKVVYLAIQEASKKWAIPIRDWKPALNRFSIEFGERVTCHGAFTTSSGHFQISIKNDESVTVY